MAQSTNTLHLKKKRIAIGATVTEATRLKRKNLHVKILSQKVLKLQQCSKLFYILWEIILPSVFGNQNQIKRFFNEITYCSACGTAYTCSMFLNILF